jgi:hypothetical protein
MAQFIPGTDTVVKSADSLLEVLASRQTPLRAGKHVFQLVVTDDTGNTSEPATVTVIVRDNQRPTAVIDFIDENGRQNPEPTVEIAFGTRFGLSAKRSGDPDGDVVGFTWELLAR